MKLRDINAFTAVVETGSVQQAAGKLGLTQSAVTRLIQRLEDEFGITLFDRRSKPFKLTRDGELAFAHATRILRLTAEMADALATSPEPKGPVHVGLAHPFTAAVAGRVSTAVRAAFPAVQMHIYADWTQRLLKSVSDGVLDAALILLPEDRTPPTDLIAVPLFEDRLGVIGRRGRRTRQQRTLAFLNDTGWILNPDGCGVRRGLEAALSRLNITPNILVEAHGLELQLALAAQGIGYTLQPSRLVGALDERPRPDKQIILSLVLLVFVTLGTCPGAAEGGRQQAASEPNAHLADTIVTWLSADFSLPENYQHPRIEIVSPMHMAAVRYRGLGAFLQARVVSDEQWLERMRDTVALYEDNRRTIYLREGWTGATPTETSVLVHEMVHHLQNLTGERFECAQAREKPAYAAQKKWLETAGLDLFREFETDPVTLMLRTACGF